MFHWQPHGVISLPGKQAKLSTGTGAGGSVGTGAGSVGSGLY